MGETDKMIFDAFRDVDRRENINTGESIEIIRVSTPTQKGQTYPYPLTHWRKTRGARPLLDKAIPMVLMVINKN